MDPMSWDYILKYVILGDSSVGKSSLLVRLTDDRFGLTEPTLGVEFGSRIVEVRDGDGKRKRVKVQCWDTAGTESFRSITRSYFRGAAGALLVYDVTRRDSFDHVTSWLKDLREHTEDNVAIVLIANKTDLVSPDPPSSSSSSPSSPPPSSPALSPSSPAPPPGAEPSTSPAPHSGPPRADLKPRAVSTREGELYAKQNGLLYLETSAKEGWNVVEAFERTAREVLRRYGEDELRRKQRPGGVKLDAKRQRKEKGGCC